jgi:aspartate aminotransferase
MVGALAYATRVLGFVNAPALMQRVVAQLIDAQVDVSIYARRRDAFKEVLDAAGIPYIEPEGAFYLFCQVPARRHGPSGATDSATPIDVQFVNHLKDHLILAVPGTGFGASGYFRLAYCIDEPIIRNSSGAFKKAMESW